MAIRTREEIISAITTQLGNNNSDEAIAIIEDVTDTLADLENKSNGDGTDWKAKYEQNDKAWRDKYISRFSKGGTEENNEPPKPENKKDYSYESLFK